MQISCILVALLIVSNVAELEAIRIKIHFKRPSRDKKHDHCRAQNESLPDEESLVQRSKERDIPEKHIVVVIPSYNNKKLYEQNLRSVLEQEYSNYHVIYIDDCSSDGTGDLVKAFIQKYNLQDKYRLTRNPLRCRPSRNIYHAIHTYCADEDIVVILDGDDWFAQKYALAIINEAYEDSDVWLTYGDHRMTDGRGGRTKPISQEVIQNNAYRKIPWCITHPRSYYAWLYKLIKLEDLQYQGNFIPMAQDCAKMLPMLEMSGGKFKYIQDVLYIYYTHSRIHNFRYDSKLQLMLANMVMSKPSYQPLQKVKKKSTTYTEPFSYFLVVFTELDKATCTEQLEIILPRMSGISKVYICNENYTQEIQNISSIPVEFLKMDGTMSECCKCLLEMRSVQEDYCFVASDSIFNHAFDVPSAIKLLRQTEALVVSYGYYLNNKKQDPQNTTYLQEGIFTFQLGWKPRLLYPYREFAHVFPTHALREYLTKVDILCDDKLSLKVTHDKQCAERSGLLCVTA